MRAALWPEESAAAHAAALLTDRDRASFVAETAEGKAIGFAELAVRKYASGCDSQPVPFIRVVEQPVRRAMSFSPTQSGRPRRASGRQSNNPPPIRSGLAPRGHARSCGVSSR